MLPPEVAPLTLPLSTPVRPLSGVDHLMSFHVGSVSKEFTTAHYRALIGLLPCVNAQVALQRGLLSERLQTRRVGTLEGLLPTVLLTVPLQRKPSLERITTGREATHVGIQLTTHCTTGTVVLPTSTRPLLPFTGRRGGGGRGGRRGRGRGGGGGGRLPSLMRRPPSLLLPPLPTTAPLLLPLHLLLLVPPHIPCGGVGLFLDAPVVLLLLHCPLPGGFLPLVLLMARSLTVALVHRTHRVGAHRGPMRGGMDSTRGTTTQSGKNEGRKERSRHVSRGRTGMRRGERGRTSTMGVRVGLRGVGGEGWWGGTVALMRRGMMKAHGVMRWRSMSGVGHGRIGGSVVGVGMSGAVGMRGI